ncbi:EAL domain-containing protein [Achromobacter pestifer]|uniref:cyclic-guanylate-specific phosphodiesterase n=1 Tax=Achromobacter pestifer TaxID=1353889 RepID=A0A6S6ZIK5_9BURK|nr:EAL domain-containing protein [Achromobacter pestifer]CAB3669830.1 putative cyclic di-GMP phosphodiesterase PdeB [Achromobacter pestifer]
MIAAAVLCTPMLVSPYLALKRAVAEETRRNERLTVIALERAGLIYRTVKAALAMLSAQDRMPCSSAHVAALRHLAVSSDFAEEVDFVRNQRALCSSWGVARPSYPVEPSGLPNADGIDVFAYRHPRLPPENAWQVAFMKGHYVVMVDPSRFTDPVASAKAQLAVLRSDGTPLAVSNLADGEMAGPAGMRRVREDLVTEGQDGNWKVSVALARAHVAARAEQLQNVFLIAGYFVAALALLPLIYLARKSMSPAGELAAAIRRREFTVHYQPIMDLRTRRCIGAEALVRWRRPDGSLEAPANFIGLAESSGLAPALTRLVIDEVLREMAALLKSEPSLHIAINLCPEDVETGRAVDYLDRAMFGRGLAYSQIWLEATESGFIDLDRACASLSAARDTGHTIALDDFGTGYSSLLYLRSLPLDVLKIDRSFVEPLGVGGEDARITAHIVELALDLGLTLVAEGIETPEQEVLLRKLGVHAGQGWLYSRPLPGEAFGAFYQLNRREIGLH